jgi:hypothetical protein
MSPPSSGLKHQPSVTLLWLLSGFLLFNTEDAGDVSPKRRLPFDKLHGIISHKIESFITIAENLKSYKFKFLKRGLKVCDDGTLIQILCFWTLSIVLLLSKTPSCFCLRQASAFLGSRTTYSSLRFFPRLWVSVHICYASLSWNSGEETEP